MAGLEARNVTPRPEPTPPADLFRALREHLPSIARSRRINIHVEEDCPDVFVDPSLALEILANFLENAHQAAPAGSAIELSAGVDPVRGERVRLEVADRGPGLADSGEGAESSDTPRHGLGLEIARSPGSASGGQVTLENRSGGGAVARVEFPAPRLPVLTEAGE